MESVLPGSLCGSHAEDRDVRKGETSHRLHRHLHHRRRVVECVVVILLSCSDLVLVSVDKGVHSISFS